MDDDTTQPHGYSPQKDALLKRLRRIEGQVRGIAKMVDEGRYCIDILQQTAAVNAAIDKVALAVLEDHVRSCMVAGSADDARRDVMTAELMGAVSRLVRS